MMDVYLETGKKKAIAGAVEWPGWCRVARDEESALRSLLAYAPRYQSALALEGIDVEIPRDLPDLTVVERLDGGSGTDFGVPEKAPSADARPVEGHELERLQTMLRACWHALDRAAKGAAGKELRKGPRGGGRELEAIIRHVLGAEQGYLTSLGWKTQIDENLDLPVLLEQTRKAVLEGMAAAPRGDVETVGPRGGRRWSLRYFTRREAWHVLDHAWEIEDRIV